MNILPTCQNRRFSLTVRFLFFGLLLSVCVGPLSAVDMRMMPAPPAPEADYGTEGASGFDVGIGYARGWYKGGVSASLNGAAAEAVYRGVIARKIGFTVVPLSASWIAGEVLGFSTDSLTLGSGFSAGTRLFGRADSYNAVIFGGGIYGWGLSREDQALGKYRLSTHLLGFAAGAKFQLAPARRVRIVPFYVYMGGGGRYSLESDFPPISEKGGLGYVDYHLIGLDFNIYGVTAKFVMDLFGDDYGSFSCVVEIRRTVRGVKKALGDA